MRRNGTRIQNGVKVQRFLCQPTNGDAAHQFFAPLAGDAPIQPAPPSPPERCPEHPTSRVVRDGKARSNRGVERQRYRCYPKNGDEPHRFTPALSRLVVNHGDTCPTCATHRSINQGDTNAARRHRFTAAIAAQALIHLADGQSYGGVSVWAQSEMDRHRTHDEPAAPLTGRAGARQRSRAWRLAADWVENFSPVLFEPWSSRRREEIIELRGRSAKDRPFIALMLDDLPIYVKSRPGISQRERFAVIAASETIIDPHSNRRTTRLRLLRAFANHAAEAYTLVLDELGYVPDLLIADGSKSISSAAQLLAARHPDQPFQMCLSAFHVRNQLTSQFAKLRESYGFQPGDLALRLDNWSFIESSFSWQTWWSDYERRLAAQGIPGTAHRADWIETKKPLVDAQMPLFDEFHVVPRSTGALEATLFRVVKPSLSGRSLGFGNLERTNRLLDLMVLRANNELDSVATLVAKMNADARSHDGYVPPVRSIADVRMTRSLLDDTVPAKLVRERGLVR